MTERGRYRLALACTGLSGLFYGMVAMGLMLGEGVQKDGSIGWSPLQPLFMFGFGGASVFFVVTFAQLLGAMSEPDSSESKARLIKRSALAPMAFVAVMAVFAVARILDGIAGEAAACLLFAIVGARLIYWLWLPSPHKANQSGT